MGRGWRLAWALCALTAFLACTRRNPAYCYESSECASLQCNVDSHTCVPGGADAGGDAGDGSADASADGPSDGAMDGFGGAADALTDGTGGDASDASDAKGRCTGPTDCTGDGGANVCDVDAGTCVGCVLNTDCTGSSHACDPETKKCVECNASTPCMNAAKPYCNAVGACVACQLLAPQSCAMVDPPHPVCGSAGSCVECNANAQCTKDPAKPYCNTAGSCAGCAALGAQACATMDPPHPVCGPAGKCLECNVSSDCKTAAKPICDAGVCRTCRADSECTSGPQVCMAHQDGRCAIDAETIYVQKTAACPGAAATASGLAAAPFCSMDPALAALSGARSLIVVRGTVNSATSGIAKATGQVSIVGQMSATISGADPALHVVLGDLYARALKLGPSAAAGAQADSGAILRLDRVAVPEIPGGGILLNGAAFDIENTTVTSNGPATQGATAWGGIFVANPPGGGPAKLQFVTVQNNNQVGVSCSSSVSANRCPRIGEYRRRGRRLHLHVQVLRGRQLDVRGSVERQLSARIRK